MDIQTLKDEIAWYHGAIAGMMNIDDPDPEVWEHLIEQFLARWALLNHGEECTAPPA